MDKKNKILLVIIIFLGLFQTGFSADFEFSDVGSCRYFDMMEQTADCHNDISKLTCDSLDGAFFFGDDCINEQLFTCFNGVLDGRETGIDCGGDCLSACSNNGYSCNIDSDCVSDVCSNRVCQSASCADGVKNGDETGLDCGGTCPVSCQNNEAGETDPYQDFLNLLKENYIINIEGIRNDSSIQYMSINLKEGNVVEEEDSDAYLLFEVEQETVQDIFAKGGNLGETFFDNIVSGKIKMSKLDNRGIFESMGDWVSGLFGDDEVFNETVECSEIHEPVCGVDGITYPNGCFANQFNIEIENSGECQENDPTSSLAQCGNLIVDLMIERDNCGMCGVSCDDDQECIAGECVYENLVQCSGKIVDVNTDNDNCGICGTSCDEDYKCSDGVCVNNVFTQCSGKNVFLDSNEANCGICGVSCENNEMCMEGICKPTSVCGDGIISISYEECDDGNNVNEDACTNDCKFKNRNLVEESCEYQAGGGMGDLMCIGGIDVETCIIAYQGDYFANSNNCDPLYPANAALVECSGKTIDIMNDESNCGMCGISCDDDYKCRNGACEIEILCGDGFLTPNEECDDGNSNNNDMCSNSCEIIEENIPQPDSCEYVHPIRGLVCETGIDVETCIIAYQGDYFDSSDCDGGSTYSSEDPNSIYNEHYVQEDEWTGTSCLYAHPGSGDMTCTNGVDIGLCVAGYQGDLYNVPNCEGRGDLGIDVGCPIGEYGDGTNCFDCPRGSYQPLEHNEKGRDSCKSCPIGSYNNEAGMEICNLCEIDTYTNLTGTMKCRECTEGYSTNGLFGSQSCVEINNDDGMKLYEEELISTTISQVNKIPESVN